MSIAKIFMAAVVVGLITGGLIFWKSGSAPQSGVANGGVAGLPLRDGISIREQVTLADIQGLKAQGIRAIVDLRPDGEAADQPGSATIGEAVRAAGMSFSYLPTPHGDIPETVVTELGRILASTERPVLLYCRSGKRAARSWALAEASRAGGAKAWEISAAVKAAGQSVDDILGQVQTRIDARPRQSAVQ